MFQFLPDMDVNLNPLKKPKWILEGKDEFWVSVNKSKNYSKVTP